MTQTEARQEAKRINDNGAAPHGLIAVAMADPPNSWGGRETGWMVQYVVDPTK